MIVPFRSDSCPRLHFHPEQISETAEKLAIRVQERFPDSDLAKLCNKLIAISNDTVKQVVQARRPIVGLRILEWLLIGIGCAIVIELAGRLQTNWDLGNPGEFIQSFQAALESSVFLSASILFVLSWENRIKRRRVVFHLHELRTFAHLVDLEQITHTPDTIRFKAVPTPNSPQRAMTAFELARYFAYCIEMLSIVSKLATLYIQDFPDPLSLQAVDSIEDLTTGLQSKIWQKSMLLSPASGTTLMDSADLAMPAQTLIP